MARRTAYNLTKAEEIKEEALQAWQKLSSLTKDPAVRDYANYMIRDTQLASKLHLQRLKFKIKKWATTQRLITT